MRVIAILACAVAASLLAGCGEGEQDNAPPDPRTERIDPPAKPPRGWHTVANRRAGFTVSVPDGWTARRRGSATLLRSSDRLLAVTIAADRGEAGREMRAGGYARRAFRALTGFRRLRVRSSRRVKGSPYESRRIDGAGILTKRKQRQRVTVAAFRRPGRVTYTAVAFAAEVLGEVPHAGALTTLLRSFRARRPAARARGSRGER